MATLRLTKFISASKEDVYSAWTDKDQVEKWYGPEGFTNDVDTWDLREGGKYHLTMKAPDGSAHVLGGEFKELNPPELVFTWLWENYSMGTGEPTIVTVEFKEKDGGTELVMTHDKLKDDADVANHNKGWSSSFSKLEGILK